MFAFLIMADTNPVKWWLWHGFSVEKIDFRTGPDVCGLVAELTSMVNRS